MNIGVFGATGKVGKLLVREILRQDGCVLSSVYARSELHYDIPSSVLVTSDMVGLVESSDIIIDFSSREATRSLLYTALKHPKPIVIGTTGLTENELVLIQDVSKVVPILHASNMSIGVAILNKMAEFASEQLHGFDVEISEIHHRSKKDAPSGSALSLADSVSKVRGSDETRYVYERRQNPIRSDGDISIVSMRGGDMVGKHTVGFYGTGEYVELTHVATSRKTFARGGLKAAMWLYGRPPGLYSIQSMFGL